MNNLPDLFKLDNKTAVVTGAGGLLGAEFCRTLAEAGANVVAADIDLPAAQSIVNGLERKGHTAVAVQTDVTSPSSVDQMTSTIVETFGQLDILVNSAALDPKFDPDHIINKQQTDGSGAFETYPLESWQQALEVNLTGTFLCCQAAVRHMLLQSQGVIINMSSIYGLKAPDQRMYQLPGKKTQYKPVFYPVTKSAVLGFTRYLAAYYAGKNIRVNALSPGGVYNGHDDDFVQAYSARAVLGRMAEKDEMNGALLFLASDASAYMTGANLVVDGGWTAW